MRSEIRTYINQTTRKPIQLLSYYFILLQSTSQKCKVLSSLPTVGIQSLQAGHQVSPLRSPFLSDWSSRARNRLWVTAMNANPAKYPLISKVGNGKSVIYCGVFPLKPPFRSIADSFTEGFPNFLFRIPAFCWRNQRSRREADLQTLRFRSTPCCLYGYHPLIKYSVLENPPFVDESS